MKFGLMFFASSEDSLAGDRYRLVVESARFADRNGFHSVWVPERHFTRFGGLYPNPAVLQAALAMTTERVRLQAGSVVAPLHDPIRIAEEWAMVDNLSRGRVGVSFASGWNPDDFAFFPERYRDRNDEMLAGLRTVRRLWRGESIDVHSGEGRPTRVRIYPAPVQPELPAWLTAASNPKTYALAGEVGANLLTHLLDQDEARLARNVALYRSARSEAGLDPATGIVSVMLHTFVGADAELVRAQARGPYCTYLKNNIGLLNGLARSRGESVDVASMPERDLDELVAFLYDRFAAERGLIGTPEGCFGLVERLDRLGVDEVACLLDFGPDADLILGYLPHLARLKDLYHARPSPPREDKSGGGAAAGGRAPFDPSTARARCTRDEPGEAFHARLRDHGIEIDGDFIGIEHIWRRDGEALARVRRPGAKPLVESQDAEPAFLDACGRVLAAALPVGVPGIYLPVRVRSVWFAAPPPDLVWSHATLRNPEVGTTSDAFEGDVQILDIEGRLIARIEGILLRRAYVEADTGRAPGRAAPALIYRTDWIPPLRANHYDSPGGAGSRWLILADDSGVGVRLAARLKESGATCLIVFHPSSLEAANGDATIDPADPRDVSSVVSRASESAEFPLHGVVHLWGLDASPNEHVTPESLERDRALVEASALHVVQTQAAGCPKRPPKLWLVTRGAQDVTGSESPAMAQATLWGLGRVIAVEHPGHWGGLVDLDPQATADEAAADLFAAVSCPEGEDMIAIRRRRRLVARLASDNASAGGVPLSFSGDATYLITGGLGGIGLELAAWAAKRGAGHLALVGRGATDAAAPGILQRVRRTETAVRVFRADVTSHTGLAGVLAEVANTMPPLRGVFHLAGVLDDAPLAAQSWERFREAGAAKVEGAWNLHELTRDAPLDHFVMFSSVASLVPMPGQGNYAAANAFLDALAHHRAARGLPALTVNWGPWAGAGHAATAYGRQVHDRLSRMGIGSLDPDLALGSLEGLMSSRWTQKAVVRVDWDALFNSDPAAGRSPFLSSFSAGRIGDAGPAPWPDAILSELGSLSAVGRSERLTAYLSELIGRVLKRREPIGPRQGFFELGLDSIMALELKAKLEAGLGRTFRATLFFTHPTLESLVDYLLGEGLGLEPPRSRAEGGPEATPADPPAEVFSEQTIAQMIAREIDAPIGTPRRG